MDLKFAECNRWHGDGAHCDPAANGGRRDPLGEEDRPVRQPYRVEARVREMGRLSRARNPRLMGERRDCVGHAYKNLQHEFFLVANGPNLDQVAKQVLQEALGVAASAAIGAGLLTPSPEPTARIGAAVAAGKTAFVGYPAARGLERLASQYDVRIDHRTSW